MAYCPFCAGVPSAVMAILFRFHNQLILRLMNFLPLTISMPFASPWTDSIDTWEM